jgi:hypothetical protein
VRYAIAGYWTAYKLAFESDERIVVSSTFGDRQPQWAAEVAAAPRVALVYAKNSVSHATETAALAQQRISALGLTSRAVELKDYVVVFPDGPVSSAQIGADALPPFVS